MYESFYKLKTKPFEIIPDPDYLYMSHGHENVYTHLEYSLMENKGFVVITGEIGSGKTTIINYFLRKIEPIAEVAIITISYATFFQLMKMICQDFELEVKGKDKADLINLFYEFLLEIHSQNKRVVLVIDEAQNLTNEALEEIRMLSNFDTEKEHLLQVILVGQPELRHRLRHQRLVQFVQRVTVHTHLSHLQRDETDKYILSRLQTAGAEGLDIFSESAVDAIYQYSRGIPRLINIICDSALLFGFAENITKIEKNVIEDVIREREAGGMLLPFPFDSEWSEEAPTEPEVDKEDSLCRPIADRFKQMEKRIEFLEETIENLKNQIYNSE